MDINIDVLEEKIISILNGRKYIEVSDLKDKLSKIEVIYFFINLFNFKKIRFFDLDLKRFIDMGDYYAPYLKIFKLNI